MLEKLQKQLGDGVKADEPLAKYTTFKIGGSAKYFFDAKSSDELVKAVKTAEDLKLEYFILGGGSNILISDAGVDKFVIRQGNDNFTIDEEKVLCESGAEVIKVLDDTLKAGLIGWPWAAGLPGTIGGAIRGNAGAYGEGMGDIIVWVDVYIDGEVKRMSNKEMQFKYRHSIAKEKDMIILGCEMKLTKGDTAGDVVLVAKYNKKRQDTQPVLADQPNPGCAFKNINLEKIKVDKEKIMKVLEVTDEEWDIKTKFGKLPVGWLFEKMGLANKSIGGAEVSDKHCAFIINTGEATAEQVIMLMSDLKMRMRNELGINLEEEVQLVGF